MTTIYDFSPASADGIPHPLSDYRDKVLLIVNTASRCGFTPQYEGLETLWRKYRSAGLVVLAFPCNQFGAQEPGTSDEIARFCTMTYAVTFPILAKIDVNGPKAEPLYVYLKQERPGLFGSRAIKWNFTKFLVGRNGRVLARYSPRTTPTALERDVTAALGGG